MRLLVLGPGHPFRGGIARTTTELVRALRARGHQVPFLTPRRQYPARLYPGGNDRDPGACPLLDDSFPALEPLAPWRWPSARRWAVAADADAWIVPYWTWAWAPCWSFLLRARRRPAAVAVVHNPADHDAGPAQRLAARKVLDRCQGLFSHAETLGDELRTRYPRLPVLSHPIPPSTVGDLPAKASSRRALGLPAERRIALFLGLIRPYKGVDVLLEAAARTEAEWFVAVVGEPWGGEERALRRQVSRHGLGDRVRLHLRWVPEKEVPTWLGAADAVVLPYRSGSQSAVAALALGWGLPVVASAVGGLTEVVQDGVNGLLVEPGSAAALAAALQSLDEAALARLGAGAREWAKRVTWDSYAVEVERLVRRSIARGERRRAGSA